MNIIDRIKYNGPGDVFAWRGPHESLVLGTQVIINQTQAAVFYKDGKALDLIAPGHHILKSANIPLLEHLVNLSFDNQSPFAAEIYYINKAVNLDIKWGTQEPILILEPVYNVYIPFRAFGQFGIKIIDAKKFVTKLVGTIDEFNAEQIINYFRSHLMTRIKDFISKKIINDKISVLNISAHFNEISAALQNDIMAEFKRFGETHNTVKMFDVGEKAASNESVGGVAGAGVGMGVGFGIGIK
jgi:membrane protease subunit (stomatin/prohibitin family)